MHIQFVSICVTSMYICRWTYSLYICDWLHMIVDVLEVVGERFDRLNFFIIKQMKIVRFTTCHLSFSLMALLMLLQTDADFETEVTSTGSRSSVV